MGCLRLSAYSFRSQQLSSTLSPVRLKCEDLQGTSPVCYPLGIFKNKHNPPLWICGWCLVVVFCLFGGDFFALVRVNAIPLVCSSVTCFGEFHTVSIGWASIQKDPSCHKYRRLLTPWFSYVGVESSRPGTLEGPWCVSLHTSYLGPPLMCSPRAGPVFTPQPSSFPNASPGPRLHS